MVPPTISVESLPLETPSKKAKLSSALGTPPNATEEKMIANAQIFEYVSAANPTMKPIPVKALTGAVHESGATRIIPFDLSADLGVPFPATSPNLMAAFLRINPGDSLKTEAVATSQAFYIVRGRGRSAWEGGASIAWGEGDLFVLPKTEIVEHSAVEDAAIYWVHDAPLLAYLGVRPSEARFEATLFRRATLLAHVDRIRHEPGAAHKNRLGILLSNPQNPETKTLSHTLWSLLNCLPAGDHQRPHRHNSVALDLAVYAGPGVYTLMGPEIDDEGNIVDPVRAEWSTGGAFVTPPGWWHSHHNTSTEDAWVLPLQDAGLYTYQRTLDIRFVDEELELVKHRRRRGATFKGSHVDLTAAAQGERSDKSA